MQFYREYDLPEARHLFSFALGSTEKPKEIQKVIDFSLEVIDDECANNAC